MLLNGGKKWYSAYRKIQNNLNNGFDGQLKYP